MMRELIGMSFLTMCCVVLLGCGPTPTAVLPGTNAREAVNEADLADHPQYANWSQFEVGTLVRRQKVVTNESGSVQVRTTLRLVSKTPERIVVEQQVTVIRPESTLENPVQLFEYPAKFRVPNGMHLEQFALPSLKAKKTGEETLSIAGREIPAEIYEWKEVNEAGPMTVKSWLSEAIPGRFLREQTLIIRDGHTSLEELLEIVPPSAT
jgi:hypothetical protein